jgi:hypothetical protein
MVGKYSALTADIFSVFDTSAWKNEGINTWPSDFKPDDAGDKYVRVSIVPSGRGLNRTSASGILIIDIFTPAGFGPQAQNQIADKLDAYLTGKSLSTQTGGSTQFPKESALRYLGTDKDNPSLSRASYEIPFNFFGMIN